MCHLTIDLHLHCSHLTIRPTYCVLSSQGETATGSNADGAHARNHARKQAAQCPNRMRNKTHSYLLCCPACRGKVEHVEYESPHSEGRISVHDAKKKCSQSDTKATTLPTCARLKMKTLETPTPTEHEQDSKSAFPYRLGLNDNARPEQEQDSKSAFPYRLGLNDAARPDQQSSTGIPSSSEFSRDITKSTAPYKISKTYLRFPFTKCHHLVPFHMPETCLNDFSHNILPCGCWTGKAPDPQIQEAALFIEFAGGENAFLSVWDVTCIGPAGCPQCGAVEFEADEGKGAAKDDVDHGHEKQSIKEEAIEVTDIKEAFLESCRQWQKLEDWKDKYYGGDLAERGAKLMAESTW